MVNKNIEFCIYNFPYENPNLQDYLIRGIQVRHSTDKIILTLDNKTNNEKEIEKAFGIIINKYYQIIPKWRKNLQFWITKDNQDIQENIEEMSAHKLNGVSGLYLLSENYDLKKEKGVVVYYNLDDEYEDTVLEEIFKQVSISQ